MCEINWMKVKKNMVFSIFVQVQNTPSFHLFLRLLWQSGKIRGMDGLTV